jgi:hypothetical protein
MRHVRQAFTDPSADYRALRAQLSAAPAKTRVSDVATGRPINFDFTTRHLSAVLRFASYNDDQAALLPRRSHLGDARGQLHALASQFRVFAHLLGRPFAGMHNSVACSEDAPLIDPSKLDLPALNATHMELSRSSSWSSLRDWPKGVVDQDLHAPFKSDAAALPLSGADDPVTPLHTPRSHARSPTANM